MSRFRYTYVGVMLFLVLSTAATCYAPPRNQIAADAFLPLLIMWSWLSVVAAAGLVVIIVGRSVNRASLVLLATVGCGAASVAFDYWICGRILGRDITTLQGGAEILGDVLYVLTAVSCLAAPAAFVGTLWGLRRSPPSSLA